MTDLEITDLEITKLCAEAMGYRNSSHYNPLHNDAQAMALVKKLGVAIYIGDEDWWADLPEVAERIFNKDLNRAI